MLEGIEPTPSLWTFMQQFIHPDDAADLSIHPYLVSGNYYEWYAALAETLQPKSILEVGVRFGYSAIAMLHKCPTAHYYGIDDERIWQGGNKYAQQVLAPIVKGKLRFSKVNVDKEPIPFDGPFDLIHLDTAKFVPELRRLLLKTKPLLAPGGTILVDDMIMDELLFATTDWAERHQFDMTVLETDMGLAALQRKE